MYFHLCSCRENKLNVNIELSHIGKIERMTVPQMCGSERLPKNDIKSYPIILCFSPTPCKNSFVNIDFYNPDQTLLFASKFSTTSWLSFMQMSASCSARSAARLNNRLSASTGGPYGLVVESHFLVLALPSTKR